MNKMLFVYETEPECTGCVLGVWCDTREQVIAAMEAGEERIHTMRENFNESMAHGGYKVVEIGKM